jgi:uncharacterized protein with PQ loop repeat
MAATTLLGALGTLVGLVRALPQLFRLLRGRDAHGVSVDTAATSSVVSFGWATYGLLTEQPAVTLATGSSALVFAAVTVLALRYGRTVLEMKAAPVWLLVLLVAGMLGGSTGLGVLLPVSVLVANVPQLLAAFKEPDLTGLSLGTWSLSVTDGLVWGAYSVVAGDAAIIVFGVLQSATSIPIAIKRRLWDQRARPGRSAGGPGARSVP